MQKVIELASMTNVQTRPNPQVAAIIVKDNLIVGIGVHLLSGLSHAEIYAINQAKDLCIGATLYVNLEPCSHYGKTPPCVDAIIAAKIARVVIANQDSNPLVAGSGIKKLRNAGIEVTCGILEQEAATINKIFFHNITTKTPYITLKSGMSLDAKIATKENISNWITSIESRRDAHSYRSSHDAILVGVGTVIADNPSLTAHLLPQPTKNPIRIILDKRLETPLDSNVVCDKQSTTWIVTQNNSQELHDKYIAQGCKIILHDNSDLTTLLQKLYSLNIYTLFIEGGEKIYADFLDQKLVNQIVHYISPQLIGSKEAKHFYAGNGYSNLQTNLKLRFIEHIQLGNDLKIVSEVIY